MKCLLQRVTQASVSVAGEAVGEIDRGLLVLVADLRTGMHPGCLGDHP